MATLRRRIPPLAPVFLLGLAYALRMLNLTGESLWRDETDAVRFAFVPLGEAIANITRNGFNGPFYHFAIRGWLELAGISDFALRYFSLFFGVILVALIYALGKLLFGRRTALIAMGLATVAPVLIWYSGEGKMYTLQPALLAFAIYTLARASRTPGRHAGWWVAFVVAVSLSFYTHLLSPLFLGVAGVFYLAWWNQSKQHLRAALVALACLTLPYVPLAVWQFPALMKGGSTGHPFAPLDQMLLTLMGDWSAGFGANAPFFFAPGFSLGRLIAAALFVFIAVYAVLNAPNRSVYGLVGWWLLPPVAVYLVSLRSPLFEPRYLLWCAPAVYLLMATLLARVRWGVAVAGACAAIALLGLAAQVIAPIRPDVRGAAAFVLARAQPGDRFVFQIPYGQYGFEYYFARAGTQLQPGAIIEAPFTNGGTTEQDVSSHLSGLKLTTNRFWLIEMEAPMWDRSGLVAAWFDRDMPAVESQQLNGIKVSLHTHAIPIHRTYIPFVARS